MNPPSPARVVVDNSFAMAWVLIERYTQAADARLLAWVQAGVARLAPALLASEAASTCRKHRLSGQLADEATARRALTTVLSAVTIVPDDALLAQRALEVSGLIGAPRAYDSTYVALAEREACELWTGDRRLHNAARRRFPFVRWVGEPV